MTFEKKKKKGKNEGKQNWLLNERCGTWTLFLGSYALLGHLSVQDTNLSGFINSKA